MEEIWKDVIGYETYYKVSTRGRVFSYRSNRIVKPSKIGSGYLCISTRLNGRASPCLALRIHRLVAIAFLDNPDNLPEVNHIDGIKTNNDITNLEWCTHQENVIHASKLGLLHITRGVDSPVAKLFKEEVEQIRDLYATKAFTQLELSLMYDVSRPTISRVINNKVYSFSSEV
jgi:hypothetical protein